MEDKEDETRVEDDDPDKALGGRDPGCEDMALEGLVDIDSDGG